MKIALIGDSNIIFMPYHNNYTTILDNAGIRYTRITWDRFQYDDEPSDIKFQDSKIGHQRSFVDYLKYVKFVKRALLKENYDRIIVFGIPIGFFMGRFLKRRFKGRYIIDIRDHHKLLNYVKLNSIICRAAYVVISSPQYMKWLPKSERYLINHNTKLEGLEGLFDYKPTQDSVIRISYIGATRDYDINIKLIHALLNMKNFQVNFHGAGEIDGDISNYLNDNKVENVLMTGKYFRDEEPNLYLSSDFINVLRFNNGINNRTALPNRLYSSAYYGKPMLAFRGTYLDQIISKYNLGLVIDSFEDLNHQIHLYLKNFNVTEYDQGRKQYLSHVIEENKIFKEKLIEFCQK